MPIVKVLLNNDVVVYALLVELGNGPVHQTVYLTVSPWGGLVRLIFAETNG